MKQLFSSFLMFCILGLKAFSQSLQPTSSSLTLTNDSGDPTSLGRYVMVERGPHHQTWLPSGALSAGTAQHRVVEVATGMNFWDGQQWSRSDPRFVATDEGFEARRVQHRVRLD